MWVNGVNGDGTVLAGYLHPTDHAENVPIPNSAHPIATALGRTDFPLLWKTDVGHTAKVLPNGSCTPSSGRLRGLSGNIWQRGIKLSPGHQSLEFLHEQPCSG